MEKFKKGSAWGLLPLGVFLLLYLVTSIILKDFYKVPIIVAFLIATMIALFMNRKVSLNEKIEIFCSGVADHNVIIMLLIFILAGAFAGLARDIGAVKSTVNFGLSILPGNLLLVGIFIIACFISISVGTSVGTIVALTPIAVGIANQTDIVVALAVGTVISGAMFGDNLSMISDTTIAATKTQGCELKDKFLWNVKIVFPAAVITALIYMFSNSDSAILEQAGDYNIMKMLPYIFVLVAAAAGLNVIKVLIGGIVFSAIIGLYTETLSLFEVAASINKGIMSMSEITILSILIAGMVALIKFNGGIDYILYTIKSKVKTKKGAQLGIAGLVGLVNLCTANNTIAIVMAGPLAKDIADEFEIDSRKSASILDTFSCFFQGVIPYGAQLLMAAAIAGISPIETMRFLYYPYLMGVSALLAILLDIPKIKEKTKKMNKIS